MKNVKLKHTEEFTLSEMLKEIWDIGNNAVDYESGYHRMMDRIKEYLDKIEEDGSA